MPLEQLQAYLPAAAIALGVLVLLWGQRGRLASWLASLWAKLRPTPEATVVEDRYAWTGPTSAYVYLYEQLDAEARGALKRDVWPAVHRAVFGLDDADSQPIVTNGGPAI